MSAIQFVENYDDLSTDRGYDQVFGQLEQVLGCGLVRAFHLNDSKTELGSRVDRHEHIGQGQLGLEAFRLIVNDERFLGLPMVLETPGDEEDYRRNLQILKKLRRAAQVKAKKAKSH